MIPVPRGARLAAFSERAMNGMRAVATTLDRRRRGRSNIDYIITLSCASGKWADEAFLPQESRRWGENYKRAGRCGGSVPNRGGYQNRAQIFPSQTAVIGRIQNLCRRWMVQASE